MKMKNSLKGYGWVAIVMHWTTALAVLALFILGLWMTDLDYYHQWYQRAPHIHKSIGIVLGIVMICRLGWRIANPTPLPEQGAGKLESRIARVVHLVFYGLLLAIVASGYLISTADGRGIDVFSWFTVPATISHLEKQEDIAGNIHYWLGWLTIGLGTLHGAMALKHHFIDKDQTLRKMLIAIKS